MLSVVKIDLINFHHEISEYETLVTTIIKQLLNNLLVIKKKVITNSI